MTDDDSTETPAPGTPESSTASESNADETRPADQRLTALAEQEGWRVEGTAARVHYSGASDRSSIEYYVPSECTLYWKVPPADEGETAVPVARETVPDPLRERIREDLAAAGIDPAVDERTL